MVLLTLPAVNGSTIDTSLYETVKSGEADIIYDEEADLFVITTWYLKQLPDDGDESYDYYILETVSYFSQHGNSLQVMHSTNNAAMTFEMVDYAANRLMSGDSKFLNFFSDLNNYTKVEVKSIGTSENVWDYNRSFYAFNRYFDNTYTFRNVTEFRVLENKEVRVDYTINGSFQEGDFKQYKETVIYDSVKENLDIEYDSENIIEDQNSEELKMEIAE